MCSNADRLARLPAFGGAAYVGGPQALRGLFTPAQQGAPMTGIRWALVVGLLLLGAAPLHAQDEETPRRGERRARVQLVPGIRYGAPLGLSVYGAAILGREGADAVQGPSVRGEVGLDAARASVGWSSVSLGGTHRGQMSLIRTWDSHGGVEAGQTYAGPEVAFGLVAGVTLGHYWRLSDGGGRSSLFALGAFIGF